MSQQSKAANKDESSSFLPIEYPIIYQTPAWYKQPNPSELAESLEFPNLNTADYAKRPINRVLRMHKMWEAISVNAKSNIVIGTNKCSGREWSGTVWGFETIENLVPEAASYKLQSPAQITNLRYAKDNLLFITLINGICQLWSTYSHRRNMHNPYCLFKMGESCEHEGAIKALDVHFEEDVVATGGEDCTLKIWDISSSDLMSTHTYRFAHVDDINCIALSKQNNTLLLTCSDDKSMLLWDLRKPLPASALLENHAGRIMCVAWSCSDSGAQNEIYAGDEFGDIHYIDIRSPNKVLHTRNAFAFGIRKILPNKNGYLGLIADTNTVKIMHAAEQNIIYENMDALSFVRDGAWIDEKKFLTAGLDGKLLTHNLPTFQ